MLTAINYGYTYDAAGRIQTMTTPEGTNTFTLDAADQLQVASLTGESYTYDKTGNRTGGGAVTGPGNRVFFDGTYRYTYDAEGNRTAKFRDTTPGETLSLGDTDVTVYAYDQRNRLVAVSHVNAWTAAQDNALATQPTSGLPGSDLELRYTYDYADRRIRRSIDADGRAGSGAESVSFAAYAGDVRTLEISRTVAFPGGFFGQVVQRNFYGNGQDEILAVDQITWNGTTPTTSTYWTFSDHQDSVRDIVSGNAADRGTVVEHRQYDSFGRILSRTTDAFLRNVPTPGVGIDFAYAGRPVEAATGLSDNRARWYEPGTGRFINEDPSGFKGGDANLYRYVGNDPVNKVDPSGLAAIWTGGAKASVPAAGWANHGQASSQSGISPLILQDDRDRMSYDGYAYRGRLFEPEPVRPTLENSDLARVMPAYQERIGIRDVVSFALDALPAIGPLKSGFELATGYDPITLKPVSPAMAAVGLFASVIPGGKAAARPTAGLFRAIGRSADEFVDVARVASRFDSFAMFGKNASTFIPSRPVGYSSTAGLDFSRSFFSHVPSVPVAPVSGYGMFGRNVPPPSGPSSTALKDLFLRNAESPLFRARANAWNWVRGRSPVVWDDFMTRLRNSDFNDYASFSEARRSLGFADTGPTEWLFGLANPIRQIPFVRNAATRHELFHAVDDLTTGLFSQKRTFGLWLRAETSAHLIGGPLIGVPAYGVFGYSIYVGLNGLHDWIRGDQ